MGFVADDDPRFQAFEPSLRDLIREAERSTRAELMASLDSTLAELPPFAREVVEPFFRKLVDAFPAAALRGEFEIIKQLDEMKRMCEYLLKEKRRMVN